MLILSTPFIWGRQLIHYLDFPSIFLFVGEVFFNEEYDEYHLVFVFISWWKLHDVCDTQVVAKESSSWGNKLFLSVIQLKVNFILDLQSQHYELYYGVQRLRCLGYSISFENEFPFSFVIFLNVISVMLHALLHLHPIYVMSSSFPINTLLQSPWLTAFTFVYNRREKALG